MLRACLDVVEPRTRKVYEATVRPIRMNKKMIQTKRDSRGRVYFGETPRKRYRDASVVIESDRRISLLPVPFDAVLKLAEIGHRWNGKSLEQLRTVICERVHMEVTP